MLERWKDLFYEISDILLALVIILMMSTVITWKVTDSLAYSKDKTSIAHESDQKLSQEPIINQEKESTPISTNNENTESDPKDFVEAQDDTVEDINVDGSTNEQAPVSSSQPTMIHVEIPSGTPGMHIATILKEKGLIDNTAKFVARVEERNLSSKLKSGSFDIASGTSLDQIINVITGINN
ncbi:hypothetical protein QBE52_11950 [Clostridiaceae bacterium 35-E11]